jgi:hypothetical protein
MKPRVDSTLGNSITYPMPDHFARKNYPSSLPHPEGGEKGGGFLVNRENK